ncbi:MAG: ATP-binding protein [Candidatus Zixiibacteriota bacterium]
MPQERPIENRPTTQESENQPIRVLLVDNDEADHRLIQDVLRESLESFDVICIPDIPEKKSDEIKNNIDVILLNLNLPKTSGMETFEKANEVFSNMPIVIVTEKADENLASLTVKKGAQDYILKQFLNPSMLSRVLRYALNRHRVLEELEQTRLQQLEMKDQFLSHVSHELRTPLTSIYQFITILRDGLAGELNEEQREYLDISERNIVHLKSMIDDLLEVTRADSARLTINPVVVSAYEAISDAINTLKATAKAKGIHLSAEFPGDIPMVFADPQRLRAILRNLIDNAIKFTEMGGAITVRAKLLDSEPDFVRLSVSDTGAGIPPQEFDKIFEYLYQAESTLESSRKGLGLGLYICKTIVNLHGGKIWVNSKQGVGSTFSFTMPVYDENDQMNLE